jgi:two-component system phosphate regulon sensor histidine kinase PhoR
VSGVRALPLVWRFFLPCAALLLLTSGAAVWLLADRLSQRREAEQVAHLERKVLLLREVALPALRAGGAGDLHARLRALGAGGLSRLTVIAADGRVLADSEAADPSALQPHGTEREELREALTEPFGRARRHSESVGLDTQYVAAHVAEQGRALGWVRAAQLAAEAAADQADIRRVVVGTTLTALAAGLLAALVFARRLSRPLKSLTAAAAAVAGGDYGRRVHVSGGGREVRDLADAYNRMAEELERQIAAAQSERRELEAVLAGMVEGVVAVDAEERIVLVNAAGAALLGVAPREVQGRPLWEVVRLPEVTDALATVLRERRARVSEIRRPDRPRDRTLRLHVSPLGAPAEAPRGAVLVFHDITELRQLEQVRRDFVANASHELKTPVAAIRGLVETILDDDAMDPAVARGFLERVKAQTDRLGALVGEMLALSRLEGTGSALTLQRVDLREPVGDALEVLQAAATARGLALDADLGDDEVGVHGSFEALRRVAANLLDNALKYTPEGGRVGVRVAFDGARGVLVVEDSGPGIAPVERERVFERFYRVDKGRGRDTGGTGLGLAIVKHLVQSMGGQVRIGDSPLGGARFEVSIPAARD